MTKTDLLCLTPFILIASAPIIMMLTITVSRNLRVIYGFSVLMFTASFVSLFLIVPYTPHYFGQLLIIDYYSILFMGIIIIASLSITVFSYSYLRDHDEEKEEYFIILFVAVLGSLVLVTANHFVTFFLGLETLSISLYVLIAYLKSIDHPVEAAIKFLVIASVSTAFLLFGMGLIYAKSGTMNFKEILPSVNSSDALSPVLLTGFGLILVGIGFKLALVPFHMWAPDVYHGAPVPVTALIATVSKGAVMALALRLFADIGGSSSNTIIIVITVISVISMFTGNLLALNQRNLKRLLAYSSIAHLGYLMITLLTGTIAGSEAAVFYLVTYIITTLGAFGTISVLSVKEGDAEYIDDLEGLFWSKPWLATVMTISLLSLAGIPLTAGFMSKFYLVLTGLKSGLWLLAFSLIINSVISLYYYLRVIKSMFSTQGTGKKVTVPLAANIVLALLAAGILIIGIVPSLLTEIIHVSAMVDLSGLFHIL